MKLRKSLFATLGVFIFIITAYFWVCVNFCVSEQYTIIAGSSLKSSLPPGIFFDEALPAGSGGRIAGGVVESGAAEKVVTLKVFNIIPVKEVSVNTIESPVVYPSGECIGVKLHSNGIIVTGFADFETASGICVSPGAVAGLKSGDIIIEINGVKTSSIAEFVGIADSSAEQCVLTVKRADRTFELKVKTALCIDGHRRMGVYVKNSIAGVGTMTFSTGSNAEFAALGHGITDAESGVLLPLGSGSLYRADIIDIRKGTKGNPGEIIGALSEDKLIGECISNTTGGIYGVLYNKNPNTRGMNVAPKGMVEKGAASIICTVSDSGVPEEFNIEITSVSRLKNDKSKSFSIRVTDRKLIEKTGGIVQGMSGSPIIQNGKIVGAVTHVFVNDPTRGYGIFIENMLAEAEKIR